MQIGDVLDAIGGLVSRIKDYAAKLPAIVDLSVAPTGIKPPPDAVETYDDLVTRLRAKVAGTPYKCLNAPLLESLEAFESGKLLGTVQPLLSVLDQMQQMITDREIEARPMDERRIDEYRRSLRKILPGNRPELEEAGGA
ncbi:MAG: hypothetical protein NNA20_04905 [Nitrospira sp.]|nr:hypothetical protein [Nitrospira sp.]